MIGRLLRTQARVLVKQMINCRIDKQNEFIKDIHQDGQLSQLGEVPLLLSGLIALSVQHVRLPRSRFRAYEELTRLLLQEQPQRQESDCFVSR